MDVIGITGKIWNIGCILDKSTIYIKMLFVLWLCKMSLFLVDTCWIISGEKDWCALTQNAQRNKHCT